MIGITVRNQSESLSAFDRNDCPLSSESAKLQILTIRDLFEGQKPAIPLVDPTAFKKAQTEQREKQERLL